MMIEKYMDFVHNPYLSSDSKHDLNCQSYPNIFRFIHLINWLASIGSTQRYNAPDYQDESL